MLGLLVGQAMERGWRWRLLGQEWQAVPGSGTDQPMGSRTGRNQPLKAGTTTGKPQLEPQHPLHSPTAFTPARARHHRAASHPHGPLRATSSPGPHATNLHSQALGRAAKPPTCPGLPVPLLCPCRTAVVTTGGWFSSGVVRASLQCTAETEGWFFPLKTMNVCL